MTRAERVKATMEKVIAVPSAIGLVGYAVLFFGAMMSIDLYLIIALGMTICLLAAATCGVAIGLAKLIIWYEKHRTNSAQELPVPVPGENFTLDGISFFWYEVPDEDGEFPPSQFWGADRGVVGGMIISLEVSEDVWRAREERPDGTTLTFAVGEDVNRVLRRLSERVHKTAADYERWRQTERQSA